MLHVGHPHRARGRGPDQGEPRDEQRVQAVQHRRGGERQRWAE